MMQSRIPRTWFGLLLLFLFLPFALSAENAQKPQDKGTPLYWIDPMEPTIHYEKPGKSRMGMELVPVYENANIENVPTVVIAPQVIANLGIRTAPVIQGMLARPIETVGFVQNDENTLGHVHTYVNGWVEHLFVKTTGATVKRGEKLFQLYSPELVAAQEELLIALNSKNKELINDSKQKLKSLGISDNQIRTIETSKKTLRLIDIYSPQDGVITLLNIREGARVTPETETIVLSNLEHVWIMVEVYESQASWVQTGQRAEARLPFLPEKIWHGNVDYVYPDIDISTRTLKVRLRFANPELALKPNMYANIRLFVAPKQNVISIPTEALIRDNRQDRVIVAHDGGKFEPRAVRTGTEAGDRIEILAGLQPGESVVTSAQFLIDSEANLKGMLERLTAPKVEKEKIIPTSVTALGIIKNIHKEKNQITIQHQPIAELQWPAMTMNFEVAPDVDLTALKPDQSIHFTIEENNKAQWIITKIHVLSAEQLSHMQGH